MTILYGSSIHNSRAPLSRAQASVLEGLISANCVSGDIRSAVVTLAFLTLAAIWSSAGKSLSLLVRNLAARNGQRACLAGRYDRC
jgi:hypothetical protein